MRIFITGGAGFIGSHLIDHYLAEGHDISILDNLSTGSLENLNHCKDQIEINKGDIRDADLVGKLVAKSDLVLHMAAVRSFWPDNSKPFEIPSAHERQVDA